MNDTHRRSWFSRFARWTAHWAGRPATFVVAVSIVLIWGLTGPIFDYSNTWQLVINTGTTIITFLMVFLIQNTQNRDTEAMHVKLDEIIRAISSAENSMLDLEELELEELDAIREKYLKLAKEAHIRFEQRKNESPGIDTQAGVS